MEDVNTEEICIHADICNTIAFFCEVYVIIVK
jgi:hypothetical protein